MAKNLDPRKAVHTPQEASTCAVDAITHVREHSTRALDFFIPGIDRYFAPMLPGQVCLVVAQTSNYKSGTLDAWEAFAAEQLMREERYSEAIIHVSMEESVEEQVYRMLARETGEQAGRLARGEVHDWEQLKLAATRVGSIPIFRIGESIARAEEMPNLYMSNIIRALEALASGEITGEQIQPAAIFFDYLQAFPYDPEVRRAPGAEQRRLQVASDFERIWMASSYFQCPVVVAVQAKQNLEGAPSEDFQLPGPYDVQESSGPSQRADRIITQWLPKQTHPVGTEVTHRGFTFTVTEDLMWMKVAKQRGGLPAGRAWMCQIDYARNSIQIHPDAPGGAQ